jgi:hypothetical protein
MILNNNIVSAIDNLTIEQLNNLLDEINNNDNADSIILDLADGEYDNQIDINDIKNNMITNRLDELEEVLKVDESMLEGIDFIETNKIIVYDDITMFHETSDGEIDYANKFRLKEKIDSLESSVSQLQNKLENHSHSLFPNISNASAPIENSNLPIPSSTIEQSGPSTTTVPTTTVPTTTVPTTTVPTTTVPTTTVPTNPNSGYGY